MGMPSLQELRRLWDEFAQVPVNDDDEIERRFLHFDAGTDRFEVWKWFDEQCPHGLEKDLRRAVYAIRDSDGFWFAGMGDEESPAGGSRWSNFSGQAAKMNYDEAEALCKELKKRAKDEEWNIAVMKVK